MSHDSLSKSIATVRHSSTDYGPGRNVSLEENLTQRQEQIDCSLAVGSWIFLTPPRGLGGITDPPPATVPRQAPLAQVRNNRVLFRRLHHSVCV